MKPLINKLISAGIEESEAKSEMALLQKEYTDENKIKEIVNERIKSRTPIQYLIGKAYFMDFWVKVTPKVLIPRPETEILVEETINRLNTEPAIRRTGVSAIDIGTGSGVIAIALAKLIPNIKIITIDIDSDVIKLAKENAKLNGVENKINFEVCDLFSKDVEKIFNNFDLIISNPPYIKESGFQELEPEIHLHEPKIAHCGTKENKTGTIYHERIIELVTRHCEERSDEAISFRKTSGDCFVAQPFWKKSWAPRNDSHTLLALEIDPPIVNNIKALLKKEGLSNYEIIKDYVKLDRCLFVHI